MTRSEQAPGTPEGVPAPTGGTGPVENPPDAELESAEGDLGATIAALTEDDLGPARRRRLLGRLVGQVRARGLGDLFRPRAAIRWMSDVVGEVVPHIPIRDRETLRRHYDGLDGDALAERLIRNAARATAGVGAAGGGVAAVEWAVAPTLLSAPVLLAAETVAVVTIEIKLIGELHEAYGVPLPGSSSQRAVAMIQSWASRRGVNPFLPGMGVGAVLGPAVRKQLRETLLRRFGRNLTTLGPFLTGAAVAGYLNRRATLTLGDAIRTDLRKQFRAITGPPEQGTISGPEPRRHWPDND
ncbi:hypothetical protein [Micromonospora sp. NBC_01796]|uniref:hypothetical protein n=1 Tax=Micromonospora sp. NBC_01796 TaxID=2975987 RepID=UPI002DD9D85F|nr:hypothetical protein [Micromonospora sp. NBC_01796]WSA86869.1 hypothetical protein OIE47_04405 [Micromonospora sp. NBC_01796]